MFRYLFFFIVTFICLAVIGEFTDGWVSYRAFFDSLEIPYLSGFVAFFLLNAMIAFVLSRFSVKGEELEKKKPVELIA